MVAWRVAAAQYPIDQPADWEAYAAKLTRWVAEATEGGAALAVFPEYGAMELAALDPATMGSLAGSLDTVSGMLERVDALHAELAVQFGLHILAASAPRRQADGTFRNVARLFAPGGGVGSQDKLMMTRFEREEWGIAPGTELVVFDTALGRLAIAICYDSEFPLLARAAVEAGAEVLLVPSCTDSLHGYWRVRIGAQARALEGQCYAVHAPTVGAAPWSPAVDVSHGAAAIYGPPDAGFPADGVVACGELNQPGWVFGEIDPAWVAQVRCEGAVLNFRHWPEQGTIATVPVRVERLV